MRHCISIQVSAEMLIKRADSISYKEVEPLKNVYALLQTGMPPPPVYVVEVYAKSTDGTNKKVAQRILNTFGNRLMSSLKNIDLDALKGQAAKSFYADKINIIILDDVTEADMELLEEI